MDERVSINVPIPTRPAIMLQSFGQLKVGENNIKSILFIQPFSKNFIGSIKVSYLDENGLQSHKTYEYAVESIVDNTTSVTLNLMKMYKSEPHEWFNYDDTLVRYIIN